MFNLSKTQKEASLFREVAEGVSSARKCKSNKKRKAIGLKAVYILSLIHI